MEKREHLSSRIGFLLLSAGCAIGVGNVWKFPWLAGQNGGGGFVLLYLVFVILLGLPVMIMELSLGRASQASPVKMYQKLEKPGQKWHLHGYFALLGNICLMAFYTTVAGWILYYFVKFLTGQSAGLNLGSMVSVPATNVIFMGIAVTIGFVVVSFKLQGGVERLTKYMMSALFILMLGLGVYCCTLDGAGEGLRFYLLPDFAKMTPSMVVSAMNQAFFSLSLGIGSMAIFGSYIGKDRSLMSEAVSIAGLDTLAAFMAGLIIFPACSSYGVEVNSGPKLLFNTMATVFNNMKGGRVMGTVFFLFMVFAAMSTVFAVFENILACVRELTGWSRRKGSIICAIGIFLLSLTTSLGFNLWAGFVPFGASSSWLDLWDFVVNFNLLPLGSVVYVLFCCTRYGWGWENLVAEANTGKGLKIKSWMKPIFCYVVPVAVIILYVIGLIDYPWK